MSASQPPSHQVSDSLFSASWSSQLGLALLVGLAVVITPGNWWLLGLGGVALVATRRRRRRLRLNKVPR